MPLGYLLPAPSTFLSTPSARRATCCSGDDVGVDRISIHALREEGDKRARRPSLLPQHFYPRPPRGGRLPWLLKVWQMMSRFLSTPSARRATKSRARTARSGTYFYPRPPRGGRRVTRCSRELTEEFLSTPSARRATCVVAVIRNLRFISIHALREEGDVDATYCGPPVNYFYPRPPRGGRQIMPPRSNTRSGFLSTPSARRATCLFCKTWR